MVQPGFLNSLPISTQRLILRPFVLEDADALYELHSDPRVTRYAGGTMSRSESEASLQRIITKMRMTGFGALAVQELTTSAVIGWSGIQQMPTGDGYELIYALRSDRWGQGFATEASMALLRAGFGFSQPVIDVIHGLAYRDNVRSTRVLEKLGMTFVKQQLHIETRKTVCLYSIDRNAFQRKRR
jgi:[ribosomal protein S5]-alanine N-acetyltransferase